MDDLRLHGLVGGGGSNIKSIQRGTTSIAAYTSNTDITIQTVDTSKAIVKAYFVFGATTTVRDTIVACKFINSTTIRFERASNGTPLIQYIAYEVIEFNNVKSKQIGETLVDAKPKIVSISSINTAKSIVIASWKADAAANSIDLTHAAAHILDSTQFELTFSRGTSIATVYWQIIEFN